MAQLVRLAEHGVSVRVASRGDPALALQYSNNSSAGMYVDAITNKIRDDVRFGRAFVSPRDAAARIPRLRVSPQASSKSSTKVRVWHDLTFSSVTPMTGVNEDTDYSLAPTCDHGHALRDIIWRTPYMRQRLGGGARIVLRKMDVKDAFRKCRLISRAHLCWDAFSAVLLWSTGDCNLPGATVQGV